jgi:hypothetical protein
MWLEPAGWGDSICWTRAAYQLELSKITTTPSTEATPAGLNHGDTRGVDALDDA